MNYYGFNSKSELASNIRKMLNNGMLQHNVCDALGCSKPTIIKLFKSLGIKTPARYQLHRKLKFKTDRELAQEIKKYYDKGLSLSDLSKHFGTSVHSLSQCLKRNNIKARSISNAIGILQKDIQLTNQELQIIYGILLGNGYIKRNKYTASLHYACLHEEAIKDIIEQLTALNPSYQFKRSLDRSWHQMKTLSYMCLASIYDMWYSNDKKFLDLELTPEACYWWYVGDGNTSIEALKILTTVENIDQLISQLPIKAVPYMAHNKFPTVYVSEPKERIKFLEYIGPCRHRSYSYKWKIYDAEGNIITDQGLESL